MVFLAHWGGAASSALGLVVCLGRTRHGAGRCVQGSAGGSDPTRRAAAPASGMASASRAASDLSKGLAEPNTEHLQNAQHNDDIATCNYDFNLSASTEKSPGPCLLRGGCDACEAMLQRPPSYPSSSPRTCSIRAAVGEGSSCLEEDTVGRNTIGGGHSSWTRRFPESLNTQVRIIQSSGLDAISPLY